ncbi:MAG: ECF transporter S component [Promethearchaeota archaeon]
MKAKPAAEKLNIHDNEQDKSNSENEEKNKSNSEVFEETEQEKLSQSVWLEQKSFRITLISTFTALAIVLGYALAQIPNIELFTLTIFLSGFILGKKDGAIVGVMSSFIFCFFNPLGASPLPLLSFQLGYYSLVGLMGAISSNYLNKKDFFKPKDDLYVFPVILVFGLIGAALTFFFDIFSTVVGALVIYGNLDILLIYYLSGIAFTTVHLIGNTLGFVFILPGLIQLVYKMLD